MKKFLLLTTLLAFFSCDTESTGTKKEEAPAVNDSTLQQLVINEFIAKDDLKPAYGKEGDGYDWVELYNNTDKEIDIAGYYITDKPDDEADWQKIPTGSELTKIPAKGYLVLVCGMKDTNGDDLKTGIVDGKTINIDMGLKASKDKFVALYDANKKEVDKSDDFGADGENLEDEKSFGRSVDAGKNWVSFDTPTPGKQNK
jgi:hypothetical protein